MLLVEWIPKSRQWLRSFWTRPKKFGSVCMQEFLLTFFTPWTWLWKSSKIGGSAVMKFRIRILSLWDKDFVIWNRRRSPRTTPAFRGLLFLFRYDIMSEAMKKTPRLRFGRRWDWQVVSFSLFLATVSFLAVNWVCGLQDTIKSTSTGVVIVEGNSGDTVWVP